MAKIESKINSETFKKIEKEYKIIAKRIFFDHLIFIHKHNALAIALAFNLFKKYGILEFLEELLREEKIFYNQEEINNALKDISSVENAKVDKKDAKKILQIIKEAKKYSSTENIFQYHLYFFFNLCFTLFNKENLLINQLLEENQV